jgi:hypothetical protein
MSLIAKAARWSLQAIGTFAAAAKAARWSQQAIDDDNDDDGDDSNGGDDDDASDEESYDEVRFRQQCREGRYEETTRTQTLQRLNAMKKWINSHAQHHSHVKDGDPLPPKLCYEYVAWRSWQKKNGRLAGAGTLYGITQMLKYEGYNRYGHPMPPELDQFFRDAHDAHKKKNCEAGRRRKGISCWFPCTECVLASRGILRSAIAWWED